MILLVHMLFGASIGLIFQNTPLAFFLAFLSHYLLDIFPHIEYPIYNIQNKNWKKSFYDFLKVFLDFLIGILLIFLFSNNKLIVYICALFAILPDGLTLIHSLSPKILNWHHKIHAETIHYLTKQKNFPVFWKIFTQVITVIISIILLQKS